MPELGTRNPEPTVSDRREIILKLKKGRGIVTGHISGIFTQPLSHYCAVVSRLTFFGFNPSANLACKQELNQDINIVELIDSQPV